MSGCPVTSGLSAKRSSCVASGTTNTPSCKIACAQKASSRDVSEASKPKRALNHCRSASMSDTRAMGVPQIWAASWTISSYCFSKSVSRMRYLRKASSLWRSLWGSAAVCMRCGLSSYWMNPSRCNILAVNLQKYIQKQDKDSQKKAILKNIVRRKSAVFLN